MKKTTMKQWLTEGSHNAAKLLNEAVASASHKTIDREADKARRESLATLLNGIDSPLQGGEMLCPLLDQVREYVYLDATDKASKAVAANKLTAARRLSERALETAFPDAVHAVHLRRENGDGKTFQAKVAPEKTDSITRLARQVAKAFGAEVNIVMTMFTAWDYLHHDEQAVKQAASAERAEQARQSQKLALADVIKAFDAKVTEVADKRGIAPLVAAGILADVGQVEQGIYGYWLEGNR